MIIAAGMVICMTAAFFFGAAWSRNVAERNVVKAANSEAEKEMQDEQEIAESAWGISEDCNGGSRDRKTGMPEVSVGLRDGIDKRRNQRDAEL